MNLYCHGDKGLMKRLVEDIESGVEVDEEIKERYGRMKGYLEKKDEQPGDWVYEVSPETSHLITSLSTPPTPSLLVPSLSYSYTPPPPLPGPLFHRLHLVHGLSCGTSVG